LPATLDIFDMSPLQRPLDVLPPIFRDDTIIFSVGVSLRYAMITPMLITPPFCRSICHCCGHDMPCFNIITFIRRLLITLFFRAATFSARHAAITLFSMPLIHFRRFRRRYADTPRAFFTPLR